MALHAWTAALQNDEWDAVRVLLLHGLVDVDTQVRIDHRAGTAFIHAMERRRLDMAEFLFRHGADPNVRVANDWSALTSAVKYGDLDDVKFLVGHCKMKDHSTPDTYSNLELAVVCDKLEVVRYLVENAGSDVNELSRYGSSSPLLAATTWGLNPNTKKIIRYLVEDAGADPALHDQCFWSKYDRPVLWCHVEACVARVMLRRLADHWDRIYAHKLFDLNTLKLVRDFISDRFEFD